MSASFRLFRRAGRGDRRRARAGGTFRAESVLAKHDETYMPKEVADALKKQGHWKTDGGGYGLAGASKEAPK